MMLGAMHDRGGRAVIPLELAERTAAPDGRPMAEQPAWRRDFPIDLPQDQYVARRDFTRFMMMTSVAFARRPGAPRRAELAATAGPPPRPTQPIARVDEIPVGGVQPFHYPDAGGPCLLLRPDVQTFLAFGQKCTHLGCAVVPDAEKKQLLCPCHKGAFDATTGRPLAGPPRRPLPRIVLENRDGVLYAVGMVETPA